MYEKMFYIGLVLFVIGCVVTVFLFVHNHVARMIGDITGYNARKAMRQIRRQNSNHKMQPEQKTAEKKKRRLPVRDSGTDVLHAAEQEAATDVLPKKEEAFEETGILQTAGEAFTDHRPVAGEEWELLAEEQDGLAKEQEEALCTVFRTQEDVTVLGGEPCRELPDTVLSLEAPDEKRDMESDVDDEITSVLKKPGAGTRILSNGIDALAGKEDVGQVRDRSDDPTEILTEEMTDVLTQGDEQESDEEVTELLSENDVTDVLTNA